MTENSAAGSPQAGYAARQGNWHRRFWLFWIAITAWRLCYLVISPLELAMDEAYYRDWGRLPDWGYYSKPPLIAWINTASSALFGAGEFGVRLPAVLMGAAGLLALFFLTRRLFDDRTAFWAVLLTALSPGACVLNYIMTIDAPLMFCWLFALLFFWRAVEVGAQSSRRWWLLLALAIGLGVLGKQMMLVFPVLMLLFLAVSREDRFWLRTPWPWLTTLAGFVFLLPPLVWNARHNWITFQHSAHHFEANSSIWRFLQTVPDFVAGQIFIVSPLTAVPFVVIAIRLLRGREFLRDRRLLLLLLFSFLPLLLFFVESFRQRINANWPAVFYPTAIILTAAWLSGSLSVAATTAENLWRARIRFWAPVTGAALVILTYGLSFVLFQAGSLAGKTNPLSALTGWRQLAGEIDALRHSLPRPDRVFFVVDHRETAAELAFYLPDQPRVFLWKENRDTIDSQYELWPGPAEGMKGWDAILIFRNQHPPSETLTAAFTTLATAQPLFIPLGGDAQRRFTLLFGEKLQSWP